MLRTIDDVVELRHWAEARCATPYRDAASGRLGLALPDDPCPGPRVGWDEWEPTFVLSRCVFVYEDAPGARRFFVGPRDEAHAWLATVAVGPGYVPPP